MSWNEIVGQDLAKRILRTHLATGRVAGAYLLAGPPGVGKRRLALEMAKALNCTNASATPCDRCSTCLQMGRWAHPDLHLLAPGGASDQIKIDQVRHLLGRVALRPFNARRQIAVIDGAQRLTEEAANSLLKSLEEPSQHTTFILITSQLADCLPTIISRCQLIRCQPLAAEALSQVLRAAEGIEPQLVEAVVRLAGGSASSAISLAARWADEERCVKRFAEDPTLAWVTQPLPETREEVARFLDIMLRWLRDLAVAAAAPPRRVAYAQHEAAVREQASRMDLDRCVETALELVTLRDSLEQFVSPRLVAALAREQWLTLSCT